jgi:hypothetical protein
VEVGFSGEGGEFTLRYGVTSRKSVGQLIPQEGYESRRRTSYIFIHPSLEDLIDEPFGRSYRTYGSAVTRRIVLSTASHSGIVISGFSRCFIHAANTFSTCCASVVLFFKMPELYAKAVYEGY